MKCSKECQKLKKQCKVSECPYWIDYPKEYNCSLVSIEQNGRMKLREVADRLSICESMVHHVEKRALEKMKKRLKIT